MSKLFKIKKKPYNLRSRKKLYGSSTQKSKVDACGECDLPFDKSEVTPEIQREQRPREGEILCGVSCMCDRLRLICVPSGPLICNYHKKLKIAALPKGKLTVENLTQPFSAQFVSLRHFDSTVTLAVRLIFYPGLEFVLHSHQDFSHITRAGISVPGEIFPWIWLS